MARSMVTEYGMSDKLGPVQYEGNHAMIPGAYNPPKSISLSRLPMKLMLKYATS